MNKIFLYSYLIFFTNHLSGSEQKTLNAIKQYDKGLSLFKKASNAQEYATAYQLLEKALQNTHLPLENKPHIMSILGGMHFFGTPRQPVSAAYFLTRALASAEFLSLFDKAISQSILGQIYFWDDNNDSDKTRRLLQQALDSKELSGKILLQTKFTLLSLLTAKTTSLSSKDKQLRLNLQKSIARNYKP